MSTAKATSNAVSSLSQAQLMDIIQLQSIIGSADFALQPFMNLVADSLKQFTGANGSVIELIEGDEMVYHAASGTVKDYIGLRIAREGSLSGHCVQSGEIEICNDTASDPRVNLEACKKIDAVSMMLVPLRHQNEIRGVLKIISDKKNAFGNTEIYTLHLLAGIMGSALGQQLLVRDHQRIEDRLRQQAQNDSLTGLPNRSLFYDRLTHAIIRHVRSQTYLCLMYMDLDGFKAVNDTYGHGVGDKLLCEFAKRIQAGVRASDTFARLGGDEFTLIAENLRNKDEATLIANKIIAATNEAFDIEQQQIHVGVSIGIAMIIGGGLSSQALLKAADSALYKSKKAGRNQFQFAEIEPG